jgi:hypothetical protein
MKSTPDSLENASAWQTYIRLLKLLMLVVVVAVVMLGIGTV